MARYRHNYFDGVCTNSEEARSHGWELGARILDTITGRNKYYDKVWNGSRFVKSGAYDMLMQEGAWDYNIGSARGLLHTPTTYGTVSDGFFIVNSGVAASRFVTTNGVANTTAGIRIARATSRRVTNPILNYTVQSGEISFTKHFHGFASYTTEVPSGAGVTNPFTNQDSGVMLGFIPGGNFKVFYNDGTAGSPGTPPTPVDTGIAPIASTLFEFSLQFENSPAKVIWQIRNQQTAVVLGSGEITTDIPAQDTNLSPHWHVESTSTAQINLYLATARLYQKG